MSFLKLNATHKKDFISKYLTKTGFPSSRHQILIVALPGPFMLKMGERLTQFYKFFK